MRRVSDLSPTTIYSAKGHTVRILNLYAGIGGNRNNWGEDHTVTAVEYDPEIAAVYARMFPNDEVVVGDALAYMMENYRDYDFIWASPPCPSHGQYRYNVGVRAKGYDPVIPDMTSLYGTITFLRHHYDGLWAVENVVPYYEPLIEPTVILQRHLVWSNFDIPERKFEAKGLRTKNKISDYAHMGIDLTNTRISNKRQVLRNAVDPELGEHILVAANSARDSRD
jgi:Site-specific DNA methylase